MQVIYSRSHEHTMKIGSLVAQRLLPGDILAFSGDLGAGKTCFIKGICLGLEVPKDRYITSPTFVLLNRYKGRLPVYHFDFYRLSSEQEVIDLGYEEYFYNKGVCLIEWAERIQGLLPESHLRINIYVISLEERKIEFQPIGERYRKRFTDIF